jgi:cytochrome c oxidase subunit II
MDRILGLAVSLARRIGWAAATLAVSTTAAWADRPREWQLGMQDGATPTHDHLNWLHDLLLVIITLITLFVLGLLIYVCVRFRASRNPVPSRTSHNTLLEVLWTALPVLILVVIAIPSFKLLYFADRAVDPDMTVKIQSHQWYWSYEYPDQQVAFDSNLIPEADLKEGQLRLLDVDNRMVVPVGKKVQILLTSSDVMHSFFIPSFGVQLYTTPGRVNETWFQVDKAGVYYGQCNQICGLNHSYMPIVVEAMEPAAYEAWLAQAKTKFAMDDSAAGRKLAALASR